MTENPETLSLEEKIVIFEGWINKITSEGRVDSIDSSLVREVLVNCGANFEISDEERLSLRKYSNLNRRLGIDAVWGTDQVNSYKRWLINEYIPQYEGRVGRELPTLYDRKTDKFDTIKHSGMLQFFGELTAFAAGEKSFADYQRLTEDRVRKGKEWQERGLNVPYEPSDHASFPPEFPQVAWGKIKSWRR